MTNDMINKIRGLRDIGHNSREVAAMLGIAIADVKQAASEPDEHTLTDGEPLRRRVERLKAELRYVHECELRDSDARVRQ